MYAYGVTIRCCASTRIWVPYYGSIPVQLYTGTGTATGTGTGTVDKDRPDYDHLAQWKKSFSVILRTWYISVCSFPIVQNYYVLIVMYRTCATCTVDVVPTCTGLCVHTGICIKLQYRLYSNVPYMYLPEQYCM